MKIGFDVVCGLATLLSLALYFYERHKRIVNTSLMTGFLHGVKAIVSSMASAGDEWRGQNADAPEGYVTSYANTSVNGWLRLHDQINDMLARLRGPAVQSGATCPCARLWNRIFGRKAGGCNNADRPAGENNGG